MTNFNSKSSTFISFLFLALLLSFTNGEELQKEAAYCSKPSKIWKGLCLIDFHCRNQCKEKEGADDGYCDYYRCVCKYKCGNVCERPSGIWSGICLNYVHCDKQCKEKENAVSGTCTAGLKCYCAFNC